MMNLYLPIGRLYTGAKYDSLQYFWSLMKAKKGFSTVLKIVLFCAPLIH